MWRAIASAVVLASCPLAARAVIIINPALVVRDLSGPAVVEPGVPFDVTFRVENVGAGLAEAFGVCIRGEVPGTTFSMTAVPASDLGASQSEAFTVRLTWPLTQSGPAQIIVIPDCLGAVSPDGVFDMARLDIEVAGPLRFDTTRLPDGAVGAPYAAFLAAHGGTAPYTFELAGLPAGLSVALSGQLTQVIGTTTVAGERTLVGHVRDAAGAEVEGTVQLVVRDDGPPSSSVIVAPTKLRDGVVGNEYCATGDVGLTANGGQEPYVFSWQSDVPQGLMPRADGVVCGVPQRTGAFELFVVAVDASGVASARTRVTMLVNDEIFPAPGENGTTVRETSGCDCATGAPTDLWATLALIAAAAAWRSGRRRSTRAGA